MDISNDNKIYQLSGLLQEVFKQNGQEKEKADFLFEYWIKASKLIYLPMFFTNIEKVPVYIKDLPDVLISEYVLEQFVNKMNIFLAKNKDASVSNSDFNVSIDTDCEELINNLIALREIKNDFIKFRWDSFDTEIRSVVLKIITRINNISALSEGKHFKFLTNIQDAQDFITLPSIHFKEKTGNYFIKIGRGR